MGENVHAGSFKSENKNSKEAGKEVIKGAIKELKGDGGEFPDFCFVFCSPEYSTEKFAEGVEEVLRGKKTQWIGGTTAGELSNYGFSMNTCVALAVESEYLKFSVTHKENVHQNPVKKGKLAAKESIRSLKSNDYLDAYIHYQAMKERNPEDLVSSSPFTSIVLTPGISREKSSVDSEIIKGLKSVFGNRAPIVGGATADNFTLEGNGQLCNGKVYEDSIIVVSILSDLKYSTGISHGLETTGKVGFVNEVSENGHLVKKIDNEPAGEVYARWLGADVEELKELIDIPKGGKLQKVTTYIEENPLGIVTEAGEISVKMPVRITKDNGIYFSPTINENSVLHFLETNEEKTLKAAEDSIGDVDNPGFAILFDCSFRWRYLKEKANKEINILKGNIKAPFVGFYTYGELGATKSSSCKYNTNTVTSIVFKDELVAEK